MEEGIHLQLDGNVQQLATLLNETLKLNNVNK